MKVGIAAESDCSDLATFLAVEVESKGHHVTEFRAAVDSKENSRELAERVGRAVESGQVRTAILICRAGISMAIGVNKVPGVRGAFCSSSDAVVRSRTENDANALCLSADQSDPREISGLVGAWLSSW